MDNLYIVDRYDTRNLLIFLRASATNRRARLPNCVNEKLYWECELKESINKNYIPISIVSMMPILYVNLAHDNDIIESDTYDQV